MSTLAENDAEYKEAMANLIAIVGALSALVVVKGLCTQEELDALKARALAAVDQEYEALKARRKSL